MTMPHASGDGIEMVVRLMHRQLNIQVASNRARSF